MFKEVQTKMVERFKTLSKKELFLADIDKDEIWDVYLNSFPEELRQGNNCNCCKSFLRQFGGIVAIDKGKVVTIWDFQVEDPEYQDAIKNLNDYVLSKEVVSVCLFKEAECGTKNNFDLKRGVKWNHFWLKLPAKFVTRRVGEDRGAKNSSKDVLQNSLENISLDAVDTVLELIDQNSLYRGKDYEGILKAFRELKVKFDKFKGDKSLFCWENASKTGDAANRIKNTAVGTLLQDITKGKDLDKAVRAFEKIVAPANYQRPKPIVSKRMIEDAKKKLEELGLTHCLNRRLLRLDELSVNNSVYVHRIQKSAMDVFDEIAGDVTVDPKTFSKVEEISLKDFLDKVLPKSKSVSLFLENRHLNKFAGLVGSSEESDQTLFSWGNNVSWAYSGDVADSIKERVKKAGGNVEGDIRVSLSWSNHDDLDIHVVEPNGNKIYYGNKRSRTTNGFLDVDMNAGGRMSRTPVENIVWDKIPNLNGVYKVQVNNYTKRESTQQGFEVEIEINGEVHNFCLDQNGSTGKTFDVTTFEVKDGEVLIKGSRAGRYAVKEKWGLKTGQFHKVKAVALSPNYWGENPTGNKHTFFFLENCFPTEKIRPFYNEFLATNLKKHKKVFEVLGSKLKIDGTTEGLAGLGFSETIKDDFYVEVEGQTKRKLKVKV